MEQHTLLGVYLYVYVGMRKLKQEYFVNDGFISTRTDTRLKRHGDEPRSLAVVERSLRRGWVISNKVFNNLIKSDFQEHFMRMSVPSVRLSVRSPYNY